MAPARLLGDADWDSWPYGLDDPDVLAQAATLGLDGVELGVHDAAVELAPERLERLAVEPKSGTAAEDTDAVLRLCEQVPGLGVLLDPGQAHASGEDRCTLRPSGWRPAVNALVHLHPETSVLRDALGQPIRLLTIDHAYYVREVRSTPSIQSGAPELAQAGAAAVTDGCNSVFTGRLGCSALGDPVGLAWKRANNLEAAARATLAVLQLGDTATAFPPSYLGMVRVREAAAQGGH